MPTISMFFGIVIRMYYAPKEHNPPHIHAVYQGSEAVFAISDGSLTAGVFLLGKLSWFRPGSKFIVRSYLQTGNFAGMAKSRL